MSLQTVQVTGLTCEDCANAVREQVAALPGVTDVTVRLAPGATSSVSVSADAPLSDEQLRSALQEAGDYQLVG